MTAGHNNLEERDGAFWVAKKERDRCGGGVIMGKDLEFECLRSTNWH